MKTFILALSGFEVLHLLKAEYAAAGGEPEGLFTTRVR